MSGRIAACFERAARESRTALVPFVTAGDPLPDSTVALMHAMVAAGADMIELGIPFSDPMADGPVIQASSERAISRGVNLERVLHWVSDFRESDAATPVVLMGYLNPIERYGYHTFVRDAAQAGVDGVLLVDCPPEEMSNLHRLLLEAGIDPIRLVAPTTSDERCRIIAGLASGFIYYVSFKGTTGASRRDPNSLEAPVGSLRKITDLPIAVGFGIRDGDSAVAVARCADAVVIGSALVEKLAGCADEAELVPCARAFVGGIRSALDEAAGN